VTSFTDSGLTPWRKAFYVVTASRGRAESHPSISAWAALLPPTYRPPAPEEVVATSGDASVVLTWRGSVGADSYDVRRSSAPGGPYTSILTAPLQATRYLDSGVPTGTTAYYVITAANSFGTSPLSIEVSGMPSAPTALPSAPAGLTARAGDARVSLRWGTSDEATSTSLFRSNSPGGPYALVVTTPLHDYVDTGLTNGIACYYVATAVNSLGTSGPSDEAGVMPEAADLAPPRPHGLTATPGDGRVWISWRESARVSEYRIHRSETSGGPYLVVGSATQPLFMEAGVANEVEHFYVVTAVNSAGESGFSNEASAVPLADFVRPPGHLQAHAGDRQVGLEWYASTGALTYHVKRGRVSGSHRLLGDTTDLGYHDAGLANHVTYYYVVSASGPYGESVDSYEVSATPHPAPSGGGCGLTGLEGVLLLGLLALRARRR
jgi:fibronectin type 3 domain-containing protein